MTQFRALERVSLSPLSAGKVDETVDKAVTASLDTAIDAILTADEASLAAASNMAKECRDKLVDADATAVGSSAYVAGRFAALADLLGHAAQRCVSPSFERTLGRASIAAILWALVGERRRNVDIARITGEPEEAVCRKLKVLKDVGAVVSARQGRDVVNALTPAAEAFTRANVRAPIEAAIEQFDLRALVMDLESPVLAPKVPVISAVQDRMPEDEYVLEAA